MSSKLSKRSRGSNPDLPGLTLPSYSCNSPCGEPQSTLHLSCFCRLQFLTCIPLRSSELKPAELTQLLDLVTALTPHLLGSIFSIINILGFQLLNSVHDKGTKARHACTQTRPSAGRSREPLWQPPLGEFL